MSYAPMPSMRRVVDRLLQNPRSSWLKRGLIIDSSAWSWNNVATDEACNELVDEICSVDGAQWRERFAVALVGLARIRTPKEAELRALATQLEKDAVDAQAELDASAFGEPSNMHDALVLPTMIRRRKRAGEMVELANERLESNRRVLADMAISEAAAYVDATNGVAS